MRAALELGTKAAVRPALRSLEWLSWPLAQRFEHQLRHPQAAQERLLEVLAAEASRTAYGRHFGVRHGNQFRERLPVVGWEDLEPWLREQRQHEQRALVAGPVRFYERTSGSSGAAKLVPYTDALLRSFTTMAVLWAHDLLAHGPAFRTGKLYFSISPSFQTTQSTERGVSVGLQDDADYLGPWLKRFLAPFFVQAPGAAQERNPEAWKRLVATALAFEDELEIVSVWNPSFLKVLLDWIDAHRDEVATVLKERGQRARARLLTSGGPVPWAQFWPELKLISCWANAGAQPLAKALAELFPGVLLQGKGLLATEAPVTIPWIRAEGHVPLLEGVLVELEEESASGGPASVRLLHEAEVGGVYKVVVSQRGGLLRYRLGDRVRVTHRYRGTPCLELLGRGDDTSDLVGEKLSESFVTRTLEQFSLGGAFFRTVAPLRRPKDRYALVVDRTDLVPEELASRLEEALCKAHHYGHARSLGQLGPLEVHIVPDADQRLQSFFAAKGMRWGDRKHRLLQTTPADDWLLNPRQGHHP